MQQPWLLARPEVDLDRVRRRATEHFGLGGEYRELGSQQDRNYLVSAESGAGALLKIHHPVVTGEIVSLQAAVAERYRDAGLATPALLRTSDGDISVPITLPDGREAQMCAFALVDGSTLADLEAVDGAAAEHLGGFVGRAVDALRNLDHPSADREIQWELTLAPRVVAELLHELPGDRRDACLAAARRAAAHLEALDDLPRQIIHGDLTADNIMRDASGVSWIIDLGDVAQSWRIAELAVLVADIMGRTGDLTIACRAVRGFSQQVAESGFALTDDELDALWPLVVLRGAVLAVSGWSQLRIDPANDYARERIEHEWQVFSRTAGLAHDDVVAQLRLAAGRAHRRGLEYAPILTEQRSARVIDLGIRSADLDRGRWTSPSIETDLAREALAAAPVAVMRFGESRLTRVSTDVSAPAPTKARCVDLWSRPGVSVHAPFSGVLTRVGEIIELTDGGVTLRFDGLEADAAGIDVPDQGRPVSSGAVIGRIAERVPGLGRLRLLRRAMGAAPDPAFGTAGDEYAVAGAADPSPILGVPACPDPILRLREERRRRDRAMGGAAERYYAEPPQIERGWGAILIDTEGRAYLDMVNNVTAIGHAHPRLADAVGRQLHLLNTNSRFLYEAYADFTERLLAHAPDPTLDTVIPVNSGSEAVDLAIRLAQAATGRRDVIAALEGYHGWTMAADSVSTSAYDNPSALDSRPDWVHLVDAPNAYRGPHRGAGAGAAYARQVADRAAQLAEAGHGPAAFICEPVLGNAGGVIPPEGYLAGAYAAVREHGGLAIADEVQVGYGRLGAAFWGSEMQGVVPDIIAVAKAAGNAYPIGAVITRRDIVDALRRDGMFFSSAAGAPASAVAGATVIDVIVDEGLQENALRVGAVFAERIEELAARHPLIGAVHGSGLYRGIELVRDRESLEPAVEETAWICERLLDFGVIVQPASERQNVLKVKPPMTFGLRDVDVFVAAFEAVLTELGKRERRSLGEGFEEAL